MADALFDLEGKILVVTGGLGQLGSAYAAAFLERGAKAVVLDVSEDPARLPGTLRAGAAEGRVLQIAADVTDRASLEQALARIEAVFGGPPHGLVNNAALDSPPGAPLAENGPFETYPEESFRRVMDVNVTGVFLCCQVMGGAMAAAGRGSIVNIGSTYGLVSPDQNLYQYRRDEGETFFKPIAYAASKSALLNLTRYLATYWGKQGVRVNTLALGGVFAGQDPRFLAGYEKKTPLGRMARPADYLGPMVYLMSDASSYMTGSTMVVDGGWTAW